MRKYALMAVMLLMPLLMMAQTAGGQVRRPVKKQTTTSAPAKKQTSTPKKQSKAIVIKDPKAVIERLVSNMIRVEGGTFTMGAKRPVENVNWLQPKSVLSSECPKNEESDIV